MLYKKNDGVNLFFLSQYNPYRKTCHFIFWFSKKNEKNEKEQKGTEKERLLNKSNLKIKCFVLYNGKIQMRIV